MLRRLSNLLGWTCLGLAQSSAQNTFPAHASLVLVNATVLDRNNHWVTGLSRDEFHLEVDNRVVPIAAVSEEDGPVSTAIVLDVSRSMGSSLHFGRAVLRQLLQRAHAGDDYALLLCADRPRLVLPLTRDEAALQDALASRQPHGATALYDAVGEALRLVRTAGNPRQAIVVVTDGENTNSRLRRRDLERQAAESNARIFVVQLWTGSNSDTRFALRPAAEASGGLFLPDVTRRHLHRTLDRLDVHRQYIVAFRPERRRDGRTHRVRLKLVSRAGRVFSRSSFSDR